MGEGLDGIHDSLRFTCNVRVAFGLVPAVWKQCIVFFGEPDGLNLLRRVMIPAPRHVASTVRAICVGQTGLFKMDKWVSGRQQHAAGVHQVEADRALRTPATMLADFTLIHEFVLERDIGAV